MYTIKNLQESKAESAASSSKKLENGKIAFQAEDQRTVAVSQRKIQKMVNSSSKVRQLAAFQEMADHSHSPAKGVIQRNAYWTTPAAGNNVPRQPFAVSDDPGGSRVTRMGGSMNHRLYENAKAARTAAFQDLKLGGEKGAYKVDGGVGPGAGTYIFYPFYKEHPYEALYTKVLVNHNADPNAVLTRTDNKVSRIVNHFHAGIIPGMVVTDTTENPCDIVYNNLDSAAEHYFDASSI